jgi:hypothetical protein
MENQKNKTIKLGNTLPWFLLFKKKDKNLCTENTFRYVFIIFRSKHYCAELLVAATSDQIYQPGQ